MIKDKEKMLKELEEKFGCTDVDVYDDMVSVSYGFNNFEVQFGSELSINTMSLLAEDLEEVGQIISIVGKYVKGEDDWKPTKELMINDFESVDE